MIHIYVSMPERGHKVYEYVGSTSSQELANMLTDPLRRYGKKGRPNLAADRLPIAENFGGIAAKFHVLNYQPMDQSPAAPFVDGSARPVDKYGEPAEEPRDARQDAMDCMARQLEIVTSVLRAATDSQALLDVADACEKQAKIGRRAMQ